jgi:hypothetical protein
MVFQGFWKALRPCIDARTQAKVQFGPPSCLLDFVDPKLLPKKYGGTLEGDIPVHIAVHHPGTRRDKLAPSCPVSVVDPKLITRGVPEEEYGPDNLLVKQ